MNAISTWPASPIQHNQPAIPAGVTRKPQREQSAEEARDPRSPTKPWPEFDAALLLAGAATPTTAAAPALDKPASPGDAARTTSGPHAESRTDDGDGATPRPVLSSAVHALTQSLADRLRTIGSGVSLSNLAQAQLQGRGQQHGQVPDTTPTDPTGSKPLTGHPAGETPPRAPGTVHQQSSLEPQIRKPSWQGTPTREHSPAPASSAALPQHKPDAGALSALDRLSAAGARAVAARPTAVSTLPASGSYSALGSKPLRAVSPVGGASGSNSSGSNASGNTANPSRRDVTALRTDRAEQPPAKRGPAEPFSVQVHRALTQALRAKDGQVTLRLTPDHLGTLRVDLHRTDTGVTARFNPATPEAQKLLADSLPDLRAALEARGLKVERLEVRPAEPAPTTAERHATVEAKEAASDSHAQPDTSGGGTRDQGDGSPGDRHQAPWSPHAAGEGTAQLHGARSRADASTSRWDAQASSVSTGGTPDDSRTLGLIEVVA